MNLWGVFHSDTFGQTSQFTGQCLSNRFVANRMLEFIRLALSLVFGTSSHNTDVLWPPGAEALLPGTQPTAQRPGAIPTGPCEHKGHQVTTHGEQESRFPGGVSKQLCILGLKTQERKDAFRIKMLQLQEFGLVYIKAEKKCEKYV